MYLTPQETAVWLSLWHKGPMSSLNSIRRAGTARLASRVSALRRKGKAIGSRCFTRVTQWGKTKFVEYYAIRGRKAVRG